MNADRKDLAPYADGLKREQGTVSEMRKLAADYPGVLRELAVVEQRADGWRTEVAQPVISATERAAYIARVRVLARACCTAWLRARGHLPAAAAA